MHNDSNEIKLVNTMAIFMAKANKNCSELCSELCRDILNMLLVHTQRQLKFNTSAVHTGSLLNDTVP